jgi:hypothetical protein
MSNDAPLWAQAIALIITGGIVAWYTWETHKIRKDAAHQNELISKQVELMFQSLKFEVGREELASEPFFKWGSGGTNIQGKYCQFQNEGGAVTNLQVKTSSDLQASIRPEDHIGEGQAGGVHFRVVGKASVPDIQFEVHYTTRLNKRGKKSFILLSDQGLPKEEDSSGNSKT